jgi:hypothetical protein
MKIKLTEGQYKKLFKEDTESSSVGDLITPKVLRIMRALKNIYTNTDSTINELINNWNLSDVDATTLVYNYEKTFKDLPDGEYETFLNEPLEFQGTYVISVNLPTIITVRSYLDYEITVRAGSRQEALKNAISKMRDRDFDDIELPETHYNLDPDLDWDFGDTELVRDMARDTLFDFSTDWTTDQYKSYIKLIE